MFNKNQGNIDQVITHKLDWNILLKLLSYLLQNCTPSCFCYYRCNRRVRRKCRLAVKSQPMFWVRAVKNYIIFSFYLFLIIEKYLNIHTFPFLSFLDYNNPRTSKLMCVSFRALSTAKMVDGISRKLQYLFRCFVYM